MCAVTRAALVGLALWAAPAAAGDGDRPTVVFLDEGSAAATGDAALRAEVVAALRAQMSDLEAAELVFSEPRAAPAAEAGLRARIDRAMTAARESGAIGVFFLDATGQDLLLYLVDPSGSRVLVRRVRFGTDERAAAVESVAIIARASTAALLEGREIGMEPVPEPPRPPPAAEPERTPSPAPRRTPAAPRAARPEAPRATPERAAEHAVALGVGYVGQAYSDRMPWQSGLALGAIWRTRSGFVASVGYALLQPAEATAPGAALSVRRHPVEACAGWLLGGERLRVGPAAALVADRVTHQTLGTEPGVTAEPAGGAWVLAAGARLLGHAALGFDVRLGAGLGLDIFFNDLSYVVETPDRRTLLAPNDLRLRAELGLLVDVL
jgi:hypothetical protein